MELVIMMKIVKRDGRTVDYDSDKIRIAIGKANNEVLESDRIESKDIENIIGYIESMGKKRMLVEDIQDIIEEKLMEKKKFHLAKVYIIYRYRRSIIRQSNTIDASILSLLKNGNQSGGIYLDANRQRDVMAGEVSKDLAYRLLLPRNVVDAEKDGRIKFCNVEYFTEPVIESLKVNLRDMLQNGTVINGIKIDPPKSFQSACNVLVEIIASIASTQTGSIYIEISDLFPYYTLSFERSFSTFSTLMRNVLNEDQIRAMAHTQTFAEIRTGIQTILYQINTITIGSGLVPKVHFLVDVREITSMEEEKIICEFIKQKVEGLKDRDGQFLVTPYPKIVYAILKNESIARKYSYITDQLLSSNSMFSLLSEKRYDTYVKEIERFNQGSVAINLARIALESSENEADFFEMVITNLSYCYEALLCRNHNLQGIYSGKSPIHWQHGAIARLDSSMRIDNYLKRDHSIMKLAICGFEAATKILNLEKDYKKKIRDDIIDTVKTWNRENSFEVVITNDIVKFDGEDISFYKKFGIQTFCDSLDFMSQDYFKTGFLYVYCEDCKCLTIDDFSDNLIIKKNSSTEE